MEKNSWSLWGTDLKGPRLDQHTAPVCEAAGNCTLAMSPVGGPGAIFRKKHVSQEEGKGHPGP